MTLNLRNQLIAADYALAQVSQLAAQKPPEHAMHPRDLAEWIEQLRDRLDAIDIQRLI